VVVPGSEMPIRAAGTKLPFVCKNPAIRLVLPQIGGGGESGLIGRTMRSAHVGVDNASGLNRIWEVCFA
jgi:hypothetical protein